MMINYGWNGTIEMTFLNEAKYSRANTYMQNNRQLFLLCGCLFCQQLHENVKTIRTDT